MTIKEIAEEAGVSRGTVDRALHGRGGVAPDVEARIRKIAADKGYIPNRAGRILAARKQPLKIGCLLPSVGNPFFNSVIEGIKRAESEFADFGVEIVLKNVRGYCEDEHIHCMEEMLNCSCSALCVCTVDVPKVREWIGNIIKEDITVVSLNTDITDTERLCYVGSDYKTAGETAAGMMRLCSDTPLETLIVTGSLNMKGHNDRIAGLRSKFDEYNISHNVVDIVESQDDDEIAYSETLRVLKNNPQVNYIYVAAAGAKGACKAISELNLRGKGNKVWVSAFDEIESTLKLLNEGMIDFTICQQGDLQGYKAVDLTFNYFLGGKKLIPDDFYTSTVIKIRENST